MPIIWIVDGHRVLGLGNFLSEYFGQHDEWTGR